MNQYGVTEDGWLFKGLSSSEAILLVSPIHSLDRRFWPEVPAIGRERNNVA